MEAPRYFNPYAEIEKSKNHLPHWEQPGACYFITFRMADSVPLALLDKHGEEKAVWLKLHPEPWDKNTTAEYHKRFSGAMEDWLDAGHGSCFLRAANAREIVFDAMRFFDQQRYRLISCVIMPNHVHVVFSLLGRHRLGDVLHSWKSFTSHEIVGDFSQAPNPFWQEDYFDRLIRDRRHFENCIRYIRRNPLKADLPSVRFTLFESEMAQAVN